MLLILKAVEEKDTFMAADRHQFLLVLEQMVSTFGEIRT